MIDQINKLIALNLMLMASSEHKTLMLKEFRNDQGSQLPGAKMLADIMQQKELIKPAAGREFTYELTGLGKQIAESGGWIDYIEKTKRIKKIATQEVKTSIKESRKLKSNVIIAMVLIAFLSILIVSCI